MKNNILLVLRKPISFKQAKRYLSDINLSDGATGHQPWVAVIKEGPFFEGPDLRTSCQEVAEEVTQQLVREAVRCDREETRRHAEVARKWAHGIP